MTSTGTHCHRSSLHSTSNATGRWTTALHDDGILTDEEYESKRQLLADQL